MTEKIFVTINSCRQGMFLQTQNDQKPVLLFLHGGPGSPEFVLNNKYPSGLDKLFTVCWWEQRGSGMSYSKQLSKSEMTLDSMISDTIAVAEYLTERFQCEKIYLMGHSWGSALGLLAAQKRPDLFYAYIGIGQLKNAYESERLAYTFMIEQLYKMGNRKMAKRRQHYTTIFQCEKSGNGFFANRNYALWIFFFSIGKGYFFF